MGIERLLAMLQEDGIAYPPVRLDVYLVHQGEQASILASAVAEQLRDAGLKVLLHCGGGSFKTQMKKADGSGAIFAVIIGDEEANAGQATLKPLRDGGEQVRISLDILQHKIFELIK
jgi:histidyl-tRNA synthetase